LPKTVQIGVACANKAAVADGCLPVVQPDKTMIEIRLRVAAPCLVMAKAYHANDSFPPIADVRSQHVRWGQRKSGNDSFGSFVGSFRFAKSTEAGSSD